MSPEMHLATAENRSRPCRVESCRRQRKGLSNWCSFHLKRHLRYGSPFALKIHAKDYRKEVSEVKALFRAFPEHRGVATAVAWLDGLLTAGAMSDRTIPGWSHFERLQRHGVTGRTILIETAALWLYAHRYPHAVRDDDTVLTFGLGIAACYLAKRDRIGERHCPSGTVGIYTVPNRKDREAIGRMLRLKLAPLYAQVVAGVQEQHRIADEAQRSLSDPFTICAKE